MIVKIEKIAVFYSAFFQRNPPIRAGEMLLRNEKYASRRVKCLRAWVDSFSICNFPVPFAAMGRAKASIICEKRRKYIDE